ncbi:hypothetical protein SCOCK_550005 [Actinacidiphila cocklensis]|uniref:Uncharacterized protein n=1 Tax=Actinacidiphila cocklensis TaxID=887465 RepID=A0A9W4GV14_9ACTN|nr:hypothetical protein SCOCK_550005 [Actinacidiphila cocklensis]
MHPARSHPGLPGTAAPALPTIEVPMTAAYQFGPTFLEEKRTPAVRTPGRAETTVTMPTTITRPAPAR